jgi:hypothetical protein
MGLCALYDIIYNESVVITAAMVRWWLAVKVLCTLQDNNTNVAMEMHLSEAYDERLRKRRSVLQPHT